MTNATNLLIVFIVFLQCGLDFRRSVFLGKAGRGGSFSRESA
jgi:hypothetical protein